MHIRYGIYQTYYIHNTDTCGPRARKTYTIKCNFQNVLGILDGESKYLRFRRILFAVCFNSICTYGQTDRLCIIINLYNS